MGGNMAKENTRQRIRVFLADDHMMVREGLASLLAKDDDMDIVGQAGHGLQIVTQAAACEPHVVVLDISLPGLNGLDVCRELARKAPHSQVLMLSMHDNEQFVVRAFEYGASGYLLKESAAQQLAEAVRTVARGDLYLDPGINRAVLERTAPDDDGYNQLTTRERQVLQLIAEGRTSREIATTLGVTVKTIETHRMHLMRKLDIHGQTNLVKFVIRKGLISLG